MDHGIIVSDLVRVDTPAVCQEPISHQTLWGEDGPVDNRLSGLPAANSTDGMARKREGRLGPPCLTSSDPPAGPMG